MKLPIPTAAGGSRAVLGLLIVGNLALKQRKKPEAPSGGDGA
jgi:hypothetical protein